MLGGFSQPGVVAGGPGTVPDVALASVCGPGEQRDAVYEEVLLDLSGLADVVLLIGRGEYEAAREHRRRFEEDMRLLDDLGWEAARSDDRDEFVLTIPAGALVRALRRLNDNAGAVLYRQVVAPIEEREEIQRALVALTAYGDLLAQLGERAAAGPVTGDAS